MAIYCLAAAVRAQAQTAPRRIALVIGNADQHSAPLKNPVNDARAVSRALKELGFEVLLKENLPQQGFVAALREFGTEFKNPDATGLFYDAGHGMQVKGANYLIPVDATIEGEDEIRYIALDANQVLEKMEQAGNRLNIVILDACRDNPFARSFRSRQTGLAQMDAPATPWPTNCAPTWRSIPTDRSRRNPGESARSRRPVQHGARGARNPEAQPVLEEHVAAAQLLVQPRAAAHGEDQLAAVLLVYERLQRVQLELASFQPAK
jgi:hypothetical protein